MSAVTGQRGRLGECKGRQSRSPDGRGRSAHSSRRLLSQPSPDPGAADHAGHVTSPKPGANWLPNPRGLPPTVSQQYFGNYVSQRVLRRWFLSALFLRGGWRWGTGLALCPWRALGASEGAAPGGRDLRVWKTISRAVEAGGSEPPPGRPLYTEATGKCSTLKSSPSKFNLRELEPPRPLGVAVRWKF